MFKTVTLTAAFAATIPLANWLIGNVGTTCIPQGPCILPVGFGLTAPSGVLVAGASLVLRDMVHEVGGAKAALIAIAIGGALSAVFAAPSLLISSVLAFLLAELTDLAVYTPLRQRGLWLAVLISGVAGAVVDSAVFLWVAFGSLDYIIGQTVGKTWMSLLALPILLIARSRRVPTMTKPDANAPAPQVTGGLWDQLTVLSGYYITQPPTPDHEFVQVCNGDLRKMVELMNTSVQAPAPQMTGRWRMFEEATGPGYWGIELEDAGNDDDAILYPIKAHRDTIARIVEAHNAALATSEGRSELADKYDTGTTS